MSPPVVLWRLRDKLTLRELPEMFAERGMVLCYYDAQDHRGIKGRYRPMRGLSA